MKKVLIAFLVLIVLLVAAAFIVPVIFKDDIKAAIDKELAATIDADIYFEPENFSLSVFRNFPNITASLKEFGVINRAPFEGEILFAAEELEIEVNLKSVLFGDQMRLKGITLNGPVINLIVLEDGSSNYDIMIASEEEEVVEETTDEGGEVTFGIDHWGINNGSVVYDDRSVPFYLKLSGLDHSGSGDFSLTVFDLDTYTEADTLVVGYDGDIYLSNKRLVADATLSMDLDQMKFTFKENSVQVNEFPIGFDGWFHMLETGYGMDISFNSEGATFKSLLSLVPGMYTADFDGLKTSGVLSFDGFVKGEYNDESMPGFNLNLQVEDAMFQYPDLPTAVTNVNINMLVDNPDGVVENTMVDVSRFHMDFGKNPIDAAIRIGNLSTFPIAANINAQLNLAELGQMFPMEGLEMKGIFALNAKANGTYDSVAHIIPALDIAMSLREGYIKSAEFPIPLEDMHMDAKVANTSGKMAETVINVSDFNLMMEGEKLEASLLLTNLDDYTWDASVKGGVDLGKIMSIFPQEGMELTGKISADVNTKGKMSDLDAERYDRLPTSGSLTVTDLAYTDDEYLKDGFNIETARASFNPREITLSAFKSTIGKSDLEAQGKLSNYLGFVLHDNEVLRGDLRVSSKLMDLNQFMISEETETVVEEDSTPMEVVPIPENIDFVMMSNFRKIVYDNMTLENASGRMVVRDGVLNLEGLNFNMLSGTFNVTGSYDTRDIEHPKIDFDLDVKNVSISESFTTFSTVQQLAPIARGMTGKVSTDFSLNGELGQDMMPNLATFQGAGLLEVAQAALGGGSGGGGDNKILAGISSLTGMADANTADIRDVIMSAEIRDGRLSVKPFDLKIGNYATNVSGSTGLDGSIEYALKMDVPAGKLGSEFNSRLSSFLGEEPNESSNIPLNLGLTGTYDDPKVSLISAGTKDAVTDAVKSRAEEEVRDQVGRFLGDVTGKKDTDTTGTTQPLDLEAQKEEAAKALQAQKDSLRKAAEAERKRLEDEAKKKAGDAVKNLFKKKKKNN